MQNGIILIALLFLGAFELYSQEIKYTTYIYTSETLAEDIRQANNDLGETRRFDIDLLNATLNSAKGIGSGYITSFVDLGVSAIGNLITRKSRMKKEWLETVNKENSWTTHISSLNDIKDFYRKPSTAGALDPLEMTFDGIGCLRKQGQDTIFFVSCHIDRSKLHRIVNHSKFELVLDTLIVSPFYSNLPNTTLPIEFSFEQRQNFNLSMKMKLISSWFTDAIELHSDEPLGEFQLSIPVSKEDLNEKGFLRYVREDGQPSRYEIVGDSFIIPRSYMGYRDSNGRYKNIWGTGQYKVEIDLAENCSLTPEYQAEWNADLKLRKKMETKDNFLTSVWQTVTSQHWDEITKSWVITTLSAPADVLAKELINTTGLGQNSQNLNKGSQSLNTKSYPK